MREEVGPALADWYRRNARILPWRGRPGGDLPGPYAVWLSEIMLQQTTVAAVIPYFTRFLDRWPTVGALARAPEAEVMAAWAGLGYYRRARNLIAAAQILARDGFPQDEAGWRALPGIGPYTASALAALAFDRRATVVDGNVERVITRLYGFETPVSRNKRAIRDAAAALTPQERPGDHAQAMMDLGATICTPRAPDCPACPLNHFCAARREGLQNLLPRRESRPEKPVRRGRVWIAARPDGAVLWVTRPGDGLLGGMAGLPTGGWDGSADDPPFAADWRDLGEVRHSLTHFHLILNVCAAGVSATALGTFEEPKTLVTRLPAVFAKALRLFRPGV